jgi:hypothetical protein
VLNPHHSLAPVLPCQQSDQGCRSILESIDHVFLNLQLSVFHPPAELRDRLVPLAEIVRDDETFHSESLDDDKTRDSARPGWRWGTIILRNRAAAGDAPTQIHLSQARFEDVTADVVEVNVDARGSSLPQGVKQAPLSVVDRGIETEVFDKPTALFVAAGYTYDTASLNFSNLSNDRTNRPRRS